jgi:hypothetical protein
MSVEEYVDGVIRRLERTNKHLSDICIEKKIHIQWVVNQANCELCGAPHAVFSDPDASFVVHILFFFSGSTEPSEKDRQFIQEFKHNLFYS